MTKVNVSKSGNGGGVFLTLFSLPFAALGVGMAIATIWNVFAYFDQQSWDVAEATIKSAKLESHRGDDSTTYSVNATYDYVYKGQTYQDATKVSKHSGSDNISSFHQDLNKRLQRHLKSKEPYICYVNPDDPDDVVLNRDFRPLKLVFFGIFAVVFGGVGFGIMFWGIKTIIGSKKINKLQRAFPKQPWLQKESWREGIIKSSGKSGLIFSIIFATFWNAIAIPVPIIILTKEVEKGQSAIYLVLLFPLVGIFLIIWAIYAIIKWKKFGESYFRMENVPGVIGGKLSGKICTTVNIIPEDGFHIKLECVNRYETGSGKNRSTRENILWESEQVIEKELLYQDLTRSEIPVVFAIPFSEKPTDESNSKNQIIWKLKVSAAVSGIDYSSGFEIPVFKTCESNPDFALSQEEVEAAPHKEVNSVELLDRGGIIISPSYSSGGMEYLFPMGRNWKSSLSLTLFTIVWNSIVVGIYFAKAPLMFLIIFGGVGILLVIFSLNSWFNKRKVEINQYSIKLSGGFMGIGSKKEIDIKEYRSFDLKSTSSQSSTKFYKILMNTVSNERYTVASGLLGKPLADAFITELKKHIIK